MRLDNKIMLCSALFIALVLLMGCSTTYYSLHPDRTHENEWTEENLGRVFSQ